MDWYSISWKIWPKGYIYQKFLKSNKYIICAIVRTPNSHGHAARLIRKCAKSSKNTHIRIWQSPEFISRVSLRSLNIPSLKALAEKLTSGMTKMPKSHDRSLCAYLMRHDADIQSRPRSWHKLHIYQMYLKSNEKQFNLSSGHQTLMSEYPDSLRKE